MIVHAAGESGARWGVPDGTYALSVEVDDEAALQALATWLRGRGVDFIEVREEGSLMALGLRPAPRKEVRRHTSSLRLVR